MIFNGRALSCRKVSEKNEVEMDKQLKRIFARLNRFFLKINLR